VGQFYFLRNAFVGIFGGDSNYLVFIGYTPLLPASFPPREWGGTFTIGQQRQLRVAVGARGGFNGVFRGHGGRGTSMPVVDH